MSFHCFCIVITTVVLTHLFSLPSSLHSMRFVFGAVCDKYGARIPMGMVLMLASIPTACIGLVNSLTGLICIRLFIGLAGSTFVMCQCWTTRMFTKEIVGLANGLVGGWGNVGGGATQVVMGSLLFPLFKVIWGGDVTMAWRTVTIVPAVVAFSTGVIVILTSDDCPKGKYKDLKKSGEMPEISAAASFRGGAIDINTWLLFIQYACCFGVELTVNNAAVTYFVDRFELTIESASAIASIFGFMVRCDLYSWIHLFSLSRTFVSGLNLSCALFSESFRSWPRRLCQRQGQ